jgi:hypothetical protein
MTPQFPPGFLLATLRKKPHLAQQILIDKLKQAKQKSLTQPGDFFAAYIPSSML